MPRSINYHFELENGTAWNYNLAFDAANNYISKPSLSIKPWTKLQFRQCAHCPLKAQEHPQCPVAKNLDSVVEDSKFTISHTRAKVTVTTPERAYFKECTTQEGLRSIFGLIMATSGCPHLDWLGPLARFHLPFSDLDETLFRVLSLQLVEQFLSQDTIDTAGSTKKIQERYANVEQVNHAFITRIREYCKADADKNAIAALDAYAQVFPFRVQKNYDSLRKFFEAKD
jgi:hypothetical protein